MGCDEMSAPAANCVMAIGEALAWQCVKPTAVRSAGDATTTTNCTYSACGAGGRHAATRARRTSAGVTVRTLHVLCTRLRLREWAPPHYLFWKGPLRSICT